MRGGIDTRRWAAGGLLGLLAVLSLACSATTRYKVLSFFFDGVRRPGEARPAVSTPGGASAAVPARRGSEHGPYAANLCSACHESAVSNTLVAPRDQLCFRCHDLRLTKRYVHGPLASGGCLVCHDPHRSSYDHLLVSESAGFCLRCHDAKTIAQVGAHIGIQAQCTTCHDAHMSDKPHLLR